MLQIRCGEDEAVLSAWAWHHDGGALRTLAGESVPFDGDAWREAAPEQRQAMVHDLLASGRLEALDGAAVQALLGPAKASPSYLRGVGTDSWEEDTPRFPVDDEGRIDHFQ